MGSNAIKGIFPYGVKCIIIADFPWGGKLIESVYTGTGQNHADAEGTIKQLWSPTEPQGDEIGSALNTATRRHHPTQRPISGKPPTPLKLPTSTLHLPRRPHLSSSHHCAPNTATPTMHPTHHPVPELTFPRRRTMRERGNPGHRKIQVQNRSP